MRVHQSLNICILSGLLLTAFDVGFAYPFLYSGINQIANSGAGVIGASDASATASNPANLADAEKTGSYGDLSIMSLNYIYAHTNYDPVYLKTVAPPVNLGLNFNTSSGVNFGFLFSPRSAPGAKPMRVNDVPTYTGAGYALFDLDINQTGLEAGLSAGYKIPGLPISIGAGLIYGEDGQEITAYANEGDHQTPGMDMKYSGASYQGVLGLRYNTSQTIAGVSFRSAAARHYKGDIASAVTDNIYDHYRGVSYHPAQFALAGEQQFGNKSIMGQVSRDFWSLGRSTAQRGLPYGSPKTDFIDSYGLAGAAKVKFDPFHVLTVSCGHYTANTGDGSPIDSGSTSLDDSAIPAQTGMEFGQMEAIPRTVIGAGFQENGRDNLGYWMFSGNYQTGTRTIPVGHKGEGWYHLEVFTFSAGMNLKF